MTVAGERRFDTVTVEAKGKAGAIAATAEAEGRLLRVIDADHVGIAFDETSTEADLEAIAALFGATVRRRPSEHRCPASRAARRSSPSRSSTRTARKPR